MTSGALHLADSAFAGAWRCDGTLRCDHYLHDSAGGRSFLREWTVNRLATPSAARHMAASSQLLRVLMSIAHQTNI